MTSALALVTPAAPATDSVVYFLQQTSLDRRTVRRAGAQLASLRQFRGEVTIDLRRVETIDSQGAALLLDLSASLKKSGGHLRLCGLAPAVRLMLEILRLHRVIEIHGDRGLALQSLAMAA